MRHSVTLLALLLCPLAALCQDAEIRLTAEERQTEVEWLRSLGLKPPEGGLLLERPFALPIGKRSFLVPSSWWRDRDVQEVTASAFRQDLSVLHTIMEKAYGGWQRAATLGWNWNKWFADWDSQLAAKGDAKIGLREALAPFERLETFQLDNHSGPLSKAVSFQSGSTTAALESAPSGPCVALKNGAGEELPLNSKDPAQNARPAKIVRGGDARETDGYYLSYPMRRGVVSHVKCGNAWIPLLTWTNSSRNAAIEALAQHSAGEPSYREISENIGYLRLPTFSKPNNELLRKLLPSLPPSAGREKLLIIDMRGNGGGDAPIGELAQWIDLDSVRPAMLFSRVLLKSCVYDALRWGYTQFTSQSLKPPLSLELRTSLQQQMDALLQPDPVGCPAMGDGVRSRWDYRRHNSAGPPAAGKPRLMVLVDRGCGSDCEGMTYMLAAEPGSVVVGENTYGVGQFIQPGYFVLPHARVPFRIALGMSDIYGDARSFDGYGLGPDIVLASEDAYQPEAILRLARTLEQ